MRKVITGEQVAQIYNRDPFARPIWRAPVYRTPLGVVLAVKAVPAARVAGPADRPAPAGRRRAGPARRHLDQPRLARRRRPGRLGGGGPGGLAVVLAVLVHPLGESPGAREVAGLVLPAPVGRCHDHRRPGPGVSRPDPAARPRQGHRHPVHRPGAGPAGLRAVRGGLRPAGGEPGARVRRPAVPGPHRQVRCGAAGVRPPRRPGRPRPRPPDPRPSRPESAPGRAARGRPAVAGQAARHACPDRGRHRGRESLAAMGPDPGHVPADASRAGPGAGR